MTTQLEELKARVTLEFEAAGPERVARLKAAWRYKSADPNISWNCGPCALESMYQTDIMTARTELVQAIGSIDFRFHAQPQQSQEHSAIENMYEDWLRPSGDSLCLCSPDTLLNWAEEWLEHNRVEAQNDPALAEKRKVTVVEEVVDG